LAFDINTFRTDGLPYGGARPSLFEVQMAPIPALPQQSQTISDSIVRCQAATLPEFRTSSIDVFYMGRAIKVLGERTFMPWTIRVYNEIDFNFRDFFEAWSNLGNTLIGNQAQFTDNILAVNNGYKVDGIIVRQLTKQLGMARSYVFFGAYPENVGSIDLNWQDGNRIETFDVQLAYDYFIPAGALNGPSGYDTGVSLPGTYDVEGVQASEGAGVIQNVPIPTGNITQAAGGIPISSSTSSPTVATVSKAPNT
jgi:hypothetical protein